MLQAYAMYKRRTRYQKCRRKNSGTKPEAEDETTQRGTRGCMVEWRREVEVDGSVAEGPTHGRQASEVAGSSSKNSKLRQRHRKLKKCHAYRVRPHMLYQETTARQSVMSKVRCCL